MNKNATPSYPEVLLSSRQVQQMLGLSRTSIWRLTRRGVLAPVHIGAALRFRRSDVLCLMEVDTQSRPSRARG
ncbi:MAG: helix-turn-helix domain-containing protein [Betaproteobacteria bacterium]|nr:helix-turn-helix domain-containing protein [Betaproteobacteria bacterium]